MRTRLAALLALLLLAGAALAFLLSTGDGAPGTEVLPATHGPVSFTPAPSATATASATPTPSATPSPTPTLRPPPTATPRPPEAAAPAPQRPAPPPAQPANEWSDPGFAARVLAAVNAERTARGLAPLGSDPALERAAAGYAQLLVQQDALSHTAAGTTLLGRVRSAGYGGPTPLGEVIWKLTGVAPPERAVSDWLASPSHRDAILSPRYRVAGAGCYFRQAERQQARCVIDLGA